jgi:hypothetical protein
MYNNESLLSKLIIKNNNMMPELKGESNRLFLLEIQIVSRVNPVIP